MNKAIFVKNVKHYSNNRKYYRPEHLYKEDSKYVNI